MNHILASQSSATSSTLPCLWPLQTQEDLNRAEEFVKDPKNFSNEVKLDTLITEYINFVVVTEFCYFAG